MTAQVELSQFHFKHQNQVLFENAHVVLETGKLYGLFGPNGVGKTTLCRALCGLESLGGGSLRIGETVYPGTIEASWRRLLKTDVFYLPQEARAALNPMRTIKAQLEAAGFKEEASLEKALTCYGFTDIQRVLKAKPQDLSGGECQRILLIMALAAPRKFLIADEPFRGLDAQRAHGVLDTFKKAVVDQGTTVLLVTHHPWALKASDALLTIEHQRFIQVSKKEFEEKWQQAVTKPLFVRKPDHPPREKILETWDLTVAFPEQKPLFEGLSFDLKKGHVLSIMGPSGVGKTTLGLSIMQHAPYQGTITFKGQSIHPDKKESVRFLRDRTSYVFQEAQQAFNPSLMLEEHFHLLFKVVKDPKAHEHLGEFMERFELSSTFLKRYPQDLSGGQIQRFNLITGLMRQPELLILDEPTTALDEKSRLSLIHSLKEMKKTQGLSLLILSHEAAFVEALSDDLYELRAGQLFAL